MMHFVFDHTCVTALVAEADPVLNSFYVEASYGNVELLVPALAAVAADRDKPGTGRHVVGARYTTVVPFEAGHVGRAAAWPQADWRALHPAALTLDLAARGHHAVLLSLDAGLYRGIDVTPLDPLE
ncbi:PIN domain-containing protein [Streptomyces fractus]|uniref:PIN domain-containing protein n=1 Tax=Streptomyces fractus TaxID=641806 RepID=UPI003CF48625